MNTHIHSKTTGNIFGPETFADNWIIVTDNNDCDIQVTIDDLIEYQPTDNHSYHQVYYAGQPWWISQDIYFPM